MKNRKNPLTVEHNCHGKLFFRWLFIILYIFYFMILVLGISHDKLNLNILSSDYIKRIMPNIVTLILFSLLTFGRLLNKSARNSMRVMKHICSYDEVYEMVENRVFVEVKNIGYEKMYESELWLKIDGGFVPKNFIVSAYYDQNMRGNYTIRIVLINGREVYYRVGIKLEAVRNTFIKLYEMIPHGDFHHESNWEGDNRAGGKVKKTIKERYEKYLSEGHTIQELVNNYVEFTQGILIKIDKE